MPRDLPARLDRATFDRVLQRAAELQASSRDIGEGLTEEEVLALGAEVGIPVETLRQALLEERTQSVPPGPPGFLDRVVGRAHLSADRVVQGTEESVVASLSKWLEYHEHLIVQRATLGRVTYEPMSSFAGAMRRLGAVFDAQRARPYLDKVETVTAIVTPLEAGFCHVSLSASFEKARTAHVAGGAVLAGFGAASGAIVVIAGAASGFALLPLVPFVGLGWIAAATFRKKSERGKLGLERALDELERRPSLPADRSRPPAGGTLARGVGRVVRDVAKEVRKALDE